jgi:transcriptional regulator with XRE-family HTH domain
MARYPTSNVIQIDICCRACYNLRRVERFYREFGRLLRQARERAEPKITQKQLADRVGLTRTSITNIELGKQHVSLHALFTLASAVGLKPSELLPDAAFASPTGSALSNQVGQLALSSTTKELLLKNVSSGHQDRKP